MTDHIPVASAREKKFFKKQQSCNFVFHSEQGKRPHYNHTLSFKGVFALSIFSQTEVCKTDLATSCINATVGIRGNPDKKFYYIYNCTDFYFWFFTNNLQ